MNQNPVTRRELLLALGGVGAGLLTHSLPASADAPAAATKKRLGVAEYSYNLRAASDRSRGIQPPFTEPLQFLDYCHQLGAGGIQVAIEARDKDYLAQLREKAEANGMYLEGSIRPPSDQADVDRFDTEVRCAREAGAKVLRTVLSSGRRYEALDSAEAFRRQTERAWQALTLAEPVAAKHGMRLAIENHKDWRAPELVAMLKRLSSAHVGVCVDTGNSMALLEDPLETVQAYAPWAFSTHLKDMAVREYEEGFLLAEVPLGDGCLDLSKIVQTLSQAQPEIHFNLEMITRDPLKIPCLTKKYWATLEDVPGRRLAEVLAQVRAKGSKTPLPQTSSLSSEARIKAEDDNVRLCLERARKNLGL